MFKNQRENTAQPLFPDVEDTFVAQVSYCITKHVYVYLHLSLYGEAQYSLFVDNET